MKEISLKRKNEKLNCYVLGCCGCCWVYDMVDGKDRTQTKEVEIMEQDLIDVLEHNRQLTLQLKEATDQLGTIKYLMFAIVFVSLVVLVKVFFT